MGQAVPQQPKSPARPGHGGQAREIGRVSPPGPYPRRYVSSPGGAERVPIETVRCGDPIFDVDGGGQHYKVLERKPVDGGGVVLELECLHNNQCQVIEKSFPAGYTVGRSSRHFL